jgi:hypothetical protein
VIENTTRNGDKRTVFTVTLRNDDGHVHSITSEDKMLFEQYPWGALKELALEREKQTKLAVEKVREKTKKTGEEEDEEKKWN